MLRQIPAVHRLLEAPGIPALRERVGHAVVKESAEEMLASLRDEIRATAAADGAATRDGRPLPDLSLEALARRLEEAVARRLAPRLRPVINATGVVLHTNLGRAPLSAAAIRAMVEVAGRYSNLEMDLATGERGSRHSLVDDLLRKLTGAEAAMVVNNNAAAVLLALSALAAGRQVIVSRGELVEIGGSFRIPEVMAQSGAGLVEVGTTNKTRAADYRRAVGPDTALFLKVHTSNYRIIGFTEEVPLTELVAMGRELGLPVMYDLGSGVLAGRFAAGLGDEPNVREAVAAGADLVTFSGDKLLGGPQAGIIAGRGDLVELCRRHPLARALRIDKLTLAALEATLKLYLDGALALREVPVLRMLATPPEELARRAEHLAAVLRRRLGGRARVTCQPGASRSGGGSLPGLDLPTTLVSVEPQGLSVDLLAGALRLGDPPVLARIAGDHLLLDPRTLLPGEDEAVAEAVVRAFDPQGHSARG